MTWLVLEHLLSSFVHQDVSKGTLVPFSGERVLETKLWMLGLFIDAGWLLVLNLFSGFIYIFEKENR